MTTAFDGLPPLRQVLEAHGLDPRKALGQNFLLDLNLTGRIARQAAPLEGATVVEVGPGPGGLTRALLAHGAGKVIAIEKDPRCTPALAQIADHYPGRLEVIEGDALAIDPASLCDGPFKIVANLPYNVGTQLLLNWITGPNWPPRWTDLTLMFQKEVAERIVAGPDDDHYGRLGVLCGWRTDAEILFDVSREAFTPPPKVTSAIVRIVPKTAPLPARLADIERVTAAAFGQRRKMLRQSVKSVGGEALLERAGIDPTRRAETLSVAEFVRLANALAA
ncbi:16S rRNA (adenine(1518)-N(6)/adenine(1519)-N(6))-dimethyltransferase RsmA [Aureimonas phyllosphaerae]|uniref:Ribosomal RNA small subunit methyltransferase A n=1 Tax=Aureimonas phyllosphaerae TaxID=1166078 RepID=A0A7W6FTK5_9HYPH|nr:16S rRNA (adenine(1518)-N(6)/adenine(1519)-N(6))-dimethyltransferase RsmA [Aureimonas phyllosphaerae]MBB3935133.1 16S rRNA (adenine1518-N6/adenine1519-N6)-dimethyltransferase [Aureimonas phyllosphaerae]MBB3959141.1 16S rRNA (adenine1518-N6/adenine1519-N6)-dimethyltransferase [Aureimonas phyllosphaerae]SFF07455.1 dimethyladenosine transferase [Aureimonas phyllosphaerae]